MFGNNAQCQSLVGFKMGLVNIVLFVALFASGYAEIVRTSTCEDTNEDICSFGEVRIDPCAGGATCIFKSGTNVSLSFDFTPKFSTSNLQTLVYWAQGGMDVPFTGFGSTDACTYTSCPTKPGQTQTLNYQLYLGTKLPKGKYNLKWKVWNEDNKVETCCIRFSIQLVKEKKKKHN